MEPSSDIAPDASTSTLPLTPEDVFKDKVLEATRLRDPKWLKDALRFSYLDNFPDTEVTVVWLYDVQTSERRPLFTPDALRPPDGAPHEHTDDAPAPEHLKIEGYWWSPDETQILFARPPTAHAAEPGVKTIYLFDLAGGRLAPVARHHEPMRSVKWSPDGARLGFVRGDDLYVLDIATGVEAPLTDAAAPLVYNGRTGWVYEEELGLVDGWAWSPDGETIAYFQVDETSVPAIYLPNYDDLHASPVSVRYPKAGDPNPIVRIGLVRPDEPGIDAVPATRWVDIGSELEVYISHMQWAPTGELLLHRMPRLQNRLDVLVVDPCSGAARVLLTDEDQAWVDEPGDERFVGESGEFLRLSDRSGYRHIYLHDLRGGEGRQLTAGDWDVEAIAGVDVERGLVWFSAALPSPIERQVFRVPLEGGAPARISKEPGSHGALFAPDGSLYLDTFSTRATPPRVTLHNASGDTVALVLDNPLPKLGGRRLASWQFETLETAGGQLLNAALLRPLDFDPARRYPVVLHTYGGPGSQVAVDGYGAGNGLAQILAQRGILVAMVDGRGSGMRGREFKKQTYLHLGRQEVDDQIAAARALGELPYVDPERIGIWGWSFGGYMACNCILRGGEVFRAAVAVAPVTDWALYDTIYTERHMRTPRENADGYEETSALLVAEKLQSRFLLIHGTADDNVHFQNSARLAQELQKHNRQFQTMFYPGKSHGLEGVSLHVHTLIAEFFERSLFGRRLMARGTCTRLDATDFDAPRLATGYG